jgi:hypothetical protein
MIRTRTYGLSLIIILAAILSGCAMTLVKYYRTSNGKDAAVEFSGYRLELNLRAIDIYDRYGTDSFRVWIDTRYLSRIEDTLEIDSIGIVVIDSLCLNLPQTEEQLCPALDSGTMGHHTTFRENILYGATYNYARVNIPIIHSSLEIEFVAHLLGRITGVEIRREKFRRPVYRMETKTRFI